MNWTMLIEYAASYTEIFVCFLLFGVFFKAKFKNPRHAVLCVLCAIVCTVGVQWSNQFSLFAFSTAVVWLLVSSLFAMLLYKVSFLQATALSMVFLVFVGVLDFFTISVIEVVFGPPGVMGKIATQYCPERTAFVIFVKCVLIATYFVVSKVAKGKMDFDKRSCIMIVASSAVYFIGLNYLVTAAVTATDDEFRMAVVFGHFFMTLFFVCWLGFVVYSGKYRKEQLEKTIISTRMEVLEEDNNQLGETYGSLAKITHDFKNHIRTLHTLAGDKNYDELDRYLDELGEDISSAQSKSYTGVSFVDAVINTKVYRAAERGIEVSVDASYPQDLDIKHTDVCAVLTNMLDNAIEACDRVSGDKRIALGISGINSMLVVKVENSSLPVAELKTVKEDNLKHGYGVKIIQSVAEKYSGTFDTSYKDGVFTARVLLNGDSGTK